jgi:hypothetical protein
MPNKATDLMPRASRMIDLSAIAGVVDVVAVKSTRSQTMLKLKLIAIAKISRSIVTLIPRVIMSCKLLRLRLLIKMHGTDPLISAVKADVDVKEDLRSTRQKML